MKHKTYKDKKYRLYRNRWERGVSPHVYLSHVIWNEHNPDDTIENTEVIHHKNKDSSDDKIENLEKMTRSKHMHLHMSKGGITIGDNLKKYHYNYGKLNYRRKTLFSFAPETNVLYYDAICINLKTGHITISHGWSIRKRGKHKNGFE